MRKTLVCLLLSGMLVPLQWAQNNAFVQAIQDGTAGRESEESVTTIRTSVQEVSLVFTATDKKGRFRKDLQATDFAVYDDGKPAAALRTFRTETDLPLRVGLVLDVSGSITDRLAFEQQAALAFLHQILRPNTDEAFVVAFDSTPKLTQDLTGDVALLANGVKQLTPGGGSALYDAIHLAAAKKLMGVRSDRPVRRIIILISDGEDNQSRLGIAEVIEAARRSEVTAYTISTNISNLVSRGDRIMKKLAEETGGRVFFPSKNDDVIRAFNLIRDELRSQYALSYKPADFDADGRYRRIEIQPRHDKHLVIRARKGYFAPVN